MAWHLILNSFPDSSIIDDSLFVTRLTRSVDWISYCPSLYRQSTQETLLPYSPSVLTANKWKQFWSVQILPEARTLYYRFLYNKLHCQGSVSRFSQDVSAACQFCQAPIEDINHLLVMCPFKWPIWQEVLSRFAPYLEFCPEDVLLLLRNLSQFEFVDNNRLLILSTYVLLFIWRAHWRTIFDHVPFSSEHIVSTALGQFSKCRPQ